jgi:hypothetical protein
VWGLGVVVGGGETGLLWTFLFLYLG